MKTFGVASLLECFSVERLKPLSNFRRGSIVSKSGWLLILIIAGFLGRPLTAQNGVMLPAGSSAPENLPIHYNGGHIMGGPHDVYFIWYGNWSGNSALSILPDFITGLNESTYFNINSLYTDNTGASVDDIVTLSGQAFDSYSQGSSLTAVQVFDVVNSALVNGVLPYDVNGIYFVLTSADVLQTSGPNGGSSSFCKQVLNQSYCGWHYSGAFEGRLGRIAFVGDPSLQCPSTAPVELCSVQRVSPNGNEGADAMANIIAHELSETVTDPEDQSWKDSNGEEVGDKCDFLFGPEFTTPNGARADVTLGNRSFLVQQLWLNVNGGSCAMQFGMPNWWPTIQQIMN